MKEIGQQFFLSHGTIRNYMSEMISKLDGRDKTDIIQHAQAKGWI
ncbi:LuxR C-terminal-related transcriptional regulator [Paenibacillus sp. sgz302251]